MNETPTPNKLACPKCGDTDSLGTLEQLEAVSFCHYVIMEDGYPTPEYTGERVYDGDMITIGIVCACGWESESITDLVPA
jgi:hypothetical protein